MSERRRCAYRDCARRVPRPGALYCSASHRELASRDRRQLRAGIAAARAVRLGRQRRVDQGPGGPVVEPIQGPSNVLEGGGRAQANAQEDERQESEFIRYVSDQGRESGEYRFRGTFGFGGKFYFTRWEWRVGYYPEHKRADLDALQDKLNSAFEVVHKAIYRHG